MCFGKKVNTIHEKKWWCWKNGVAAFVRRKAFVTDEMVCNLEHMPPCKFENKNIANSLYLFDVFTGYHGNGPCCIYGQGLSC